MHAVRIRDRQTDDIPGCLSVLADVHRADHYPLNWPADPPRWLTQSTELHAWVAETATPGIVAGHVAVHRTTSAPATVHVGRLFVAPAARRHGVAAALLDTVRRWAGERGLGLTLEVADTPRSAAAIILYENTGWQHTHTVTASWTTADGRPVRLRHYADTSTARTA